ncbi:MAG: MSCRAMM family protein [Chloroflexota bacterium]
MRLPSNQQSTLFAIFSVALMLAVSVGLLSTAPAQAAFSGPDGDKGGVLQPAGMLGGTSLCANHTWVDVSGSVTVKGTLAGQAKQFQTPRSKLTFDDNTVAYAFCTDIGHTVGDNQRYCLDPAFFSDWRIAWLVIHFPPSPNRTDQAARQAAVWHFTDGFDLNQTDPTTEGAEVDDAVRTAYNAILNAIPATQPPEYLPGNVELVIDPVNATNFLPGQEAHNFTVRLTKGGQPLSGYTVSVSTDFGSLDKNSDVTDNNGEAFFTLTNTAGTANVAHLTATAQVSVPAGSRFTHQTDPLGKQRLVLGEEKLVNLQATATKTWVSAENIIIAHKFEDRNYNQVQDAGEPNLANWVFSLTLPDNTVITATTNTAGNAYFYDKIALNGSYTLEETKPAEWTNSTPLSQTRLRSDEDAWTQWFASFGNAQYSLITVIKYEDLNGNQQWEPASPNNEAALPGWQFALYKWNGTTWLQYSGGTTGTDGSVSFTDLDAGQYKVLEQPQPDYQSTTGLEQVITLGYPVHTTLYFGNQRKLLDYGDLNENPAAGPAYGITTFGNDGGRHEVVEGSVRLGESADIEGDGQPTVNASGDGSDEDGVVRGLTTWGGGSGQVIVTVTDPDDVGDPGDPAAGCLMGWLDYYNATTGELEPDGVFTESFTFGGNTYSEKIIDNLYVPAGVNTINFALPPINVGSNWFMFARFRLSPFNAGQGWDEASGKCNQAAAGLTGLVQGGEIEDYGWLFGPTSVELQSFGVQGKDGWSGFEWLIAGLALGGLFLLWSILRKAHG